MSSRSTSIAFALFATLIGLVVRIGPSLGATFPLNDGGLFYAMMQDLRANGYALPAFAHFNGAVIPFAYPPLGFYVTSLLADLLRIDLLDMMRWLPALVSTITIPAFYLLARRFSSSQTIPALATLIFALAPSNFAWLIMGGGVTRSLGLLFAILTLVCIHELLTAPTRRLLFRTSAWAAITVLTHPEAALQTAFAALLLYLFIDRSRPGLVRALIVAVLTTILTAPWWGWVIATHGLDPFMAASSAVGENSVPLLVRPFVLFQFKFTEEAFLPVIAMLGLIGVFIQFSKRDVFLPSWLILAYIFEPRSAPQPMSIPLSLLAAIALAELILPRLAKNPSDNSLVGLLNGGTARAFFGFLFVTMTMGAYFTTNKLVADHSLKTADLQAMQWVQANTAEDSVFAILTDKIALFDAVSEWFPVMTGRVSAATAFGYEWIYDNQFVRRVDAYNALQACLFQTPACLQNWDKEYGLSYTHILIRYVQNGDFVTAPIQSYLDRDADFTLIYRTPEISIYSKNQP